MELLRAPSKRSTKALGKFIKALSEAEVRIARQTLRMPDAMVGVMGAMTKEQAREILAATRKARAEARAEIMKSLGLTKVRGNLGGTYWE